MTNTWMSRPRGAPGLAAAALLALVLGALPARAQDDPTGSWSAEEPGAFFLSGGSATDGTYLYLAGGMQNVPDSFNFPDDFKMLRRYDPATNTWTVLSSLPFAVAETAAAYHGGRVYTFGGVNIESGAITNAICAYDIATDSWVETDDVLSAARQRIAAATLGDKIHVVGGSVDGGDLTDSHDEFDPVHGGVQPLQALNVPSSLMAAAALGGRLVIAGGFDFAGPVATAYSYDPSTDAWTALANIRDASNADQPRYSPVAFVIEGRMYLSGGFVDDGVNETWEYTPGTNAWARRANMIDARYGHGGAAINGKGCVYGGSGLTTGEEFTAPVFDAPPANHAPTANAGNDQTVEPTSASGASVQLNGSGSSDPDGDALTYSWSGPFGSASGVSPTVSLPVGTSVVTLTVSDGQATNSDTVSITVADSTPPVFTQLSASPDTLWSPNKDMRNVTITAAASDNGDPSPTCQIVSVSSNQAQGNENDWQVTGDLTLKLRAERDNGQTRVYTISVRCTDASGNCATQTVTVTVPHSQGNNGDAGASAKKAK